MSDEFDEKIEELQYRDESPAPQDNKIAVLPPTFLDQYTGGYSQAEEIVLLPERVDFDKKTGHWSSESLGDGLMEMGGKLIAAVTIWAIWSEQVGNPLCLDIGRPCSPQAHEMGLRVIFQDDLGDNYMWDAFGVTFKSASGAVRRAKNRNGLFLFDGRKQIGTRFGQFYVPTLEKINEGE